MPALRQAPAHWAPAQYRPDSDAGRNAAFNGDDIYLAVLVSKLYHDTTLENTGTRRAFANYVRRRIDGFERDGWGHWEFTTAQYRALAGDGDFELAWRSMPSRTVGALGV